MEDYLELALTDANTMTRLLEEIQPLVYRLSYHLTQHQQDAEDIAQEVLYKVCTKLSMYRKQSSFQTWLYALVVNTFKDFYRKRKRKPVVPLQVHDATTSFESDADLRIAMGQLLNELPEVEKQILILRFQTGLSVKEVAEIVRLSEANVKTKVFRLKRRMQVLFQKGGEVL